MLVNIHSADSKGDIITLAEELKAEFRDKTVVVPVGFQCDGASVPRFLWSTVSPQVDPRTLRGAVVHDYLYRNLVPGWTRKEADELFYELIRAVGLSWWKSQKAYWGVRLFGSGAWQE